MESLLDPRVSPQTQQTPHTQPLIPSTCPDIKFAQTMSTIGHHPDIGLPSALLILLQPTYLGVVTEQCCVERLDSNGASAYLLTIFASALPDFFHQLAQDSCERCHSDVPSLHQS